MVNSGDWYPNRLAELDTWHANFNAQATATGTTYGLAAGDVTQIAADAAFISSLLIFDEEIRAFTQAWTAYRNAIMRGDPNGPLPPFPTLPGTPDAPVGGLPGIEARTRAYAKVIRADLDYSPAVGENYGLVAPEPSGLETPSLTPTAVQGSTDVSLKIFKGGYSVVAIDMRRGGGAWSQIGVAQTATYVDTTAPDVPGQPEQREYRAQGMVNNVRTGDVSPTVSIVTMA